MNDISKYIRLVESAVNVNEAVMTNNNISEHISSELEIIPNLGLAYSIGNTLKFHRVRYNVGYDPKNELIFIFYYNLTDEKSIEDNGISMSIFKLINWVDNEGRKYAKVNSMQPDFTLTVGNDWLIEHGIPNISVYM